MRAIKGGLRDALAFELTDYSSGKRVYLNWANVVYAEEINGSGPAMTLIYLAPNTSKNGSVTVKETLDQLFERPVTLDGRQRL